ALSRLTVEDRRNDMIKWVLRRAIEKLERDWNYDASYMRDMIDASPRAKWLFSSVSSLGQFRRDLPSREDCGPCTQLGVTMAERAGVSPAVLHAVLDDNLEAMLPDVAMCGNSHAPRSGIMPRPMRIARRS